MKQQVAITKKGELCVVTPLWPRHFVDIACESAGLLVLAVDAQEEPTAYAIDTGEQAFVVGPSVLKHLKLLGEL